MKLINRNALVLAGALAACLAGLAVRAETTSVTNGSNAATVTQSGAPTAKSVKTHPGYTRIEQHSGGNSATIVQRSGPASPSITTPNPAETSPGETSATPSIPPTEPDAKDDDDDQKTATTDAEVYREVRKGASPQSQRTLDKLMTTMGLQKKM